MACAAMDSRWQAAYWNSPGPRADLYNTHAGAESVGSSRKGQGRRHEDLEHKYKRPEGQAGADITTLMLRNVPRRYTEDALIRDLESLISKEEYDFFYLPWDNRRASNCGYAFINCVDPAVAQRLCAQLVGRQWGRAPMSKEMKAVPAHVQGIALNLAHYMGSSVVQEGYAHSPMVLQNGVRIPFEDALAQYCPPELIEKHRAEAGDYHIALMSNTSANSGENSSQGFLDMPGFSDASLGGLASSGGRSLQGAGEAPGLGDACLAALASSGGRSLRGAGGSCGGFCGGSGGGVPQRPACVMSAPPGALNFAERPIPPAPLRPPGIGAAPGPCLQTSFVPPPPGMAPIAPTGPGPIAQFPSAAGAPVPPEATSIRSLDTYASAWDNLNGQLIALQLAGLAPFAAVPDQ